MYKIDVLDNLTLFISLKIACGSEDVLWKQQRRAHQNTSISCKSYKVLENILFSSILFCSI